MKVLLALPAPADATRAQRWARRLLEVGLSWLMPALLALVPALGLSLGAVPGPLAARIVLGIGAGLVLALAWLVGLLTVSERRERAARQAELARREEEERKRTLEARRRAAAEEQERRRLEEQEARRRAAAAEEQRRRRAEAARAAQAADGAVAADPPAEPPVHRRPPDSEPEEQRLLEALRVLRAAQHRSRREQDWEAQALQQQLDHPQTMLEAYRAWQGTLQQLLEQCAALRTELVDLAPLALRQGASSVPPRAALLILAELHDAANDAVKSAQRSRQEVRRTLDGVRDTVELLQPDLERLDEWSAEQLAASRRDLRRKPLLAGENYQRIQSLEALRPVLVQLRRELEATDWGQLESRYRALHNDTRDELLLRHLPRFAAELERSTRRAFDLDAHTRLRVSMTRVGSERLLLQNYARDLQRLLERAGLEL